MKLLALPAVLRFILNHPLNRGQRGKALLRFLRWQFTSRLNPGPTVVPFVNESRLIVRPGWMGATGVLYTGLYEFEEMAFVLHALRKGDGFIDVGANIGSFTILASAVVEAESLAIEPVPATYRYICDNIELNAIASRVKCLNAGIGRQAGLLGFTTSLGASNHVLRPGEAASSPVETLEIPVQPLDQAADGFQAVLLKIDVEGYETEVIAGAGQTLAQPSLFAVLLELRGHGRRYGFDEDALHQKMLGYGFKPYRYRPFERILDGLEGIDPAGNTLYIRDLPLARQRVETAPLFRVNGRLI